MHPFDLEGLRGSIATTTTLSDTYRIPLKFRRFCKAHMYNTHFVKTSTRTGSERLARCSFATLVDIVAEKR